MLLNYVQYPMHSQHHQRLDLDLRVQRPRLGLALQEKLVMETYWNWE